MSRRDAWARLTPYEVGIPGREFAETNFKAIRDEAEGRDVDLSDPGAFLLLGEVGRVLREIQGGERGGEAIHRFGAFLFHAFHFHEANEPVLLLTTAATRHLVEGRSAERDTEDRPWESWSGRLPAPAGYIQLPRHLVWSHPDPEGPAEDLDGIFWTRAAGDSLALLAALGIRSDRPGLSVIPLPPMPLADASAWTRLEARGTDFETTLPGGELDELYSVMTAGELLKLAARVFQYLDAVPESLGAEETSPRPDEVDEAPPGTRPSFLPFRRIRGPTALSDSDCPPEPR